MTLRPPRRAFSVSRHLSERARAAKAEAANAQQPAGGEADIAGFGGFAGMVSALRGVVEQFAAAAAQSQAAQSQAAQGQAGQSQAGQGQAGQGQAAGHDAADGADGGPGQGAEHTINLGDGKARMVFGYTLRMGRDGISAEPFGNTPAAGAEKRGTAKAGSAPAALQPIIEVFEDGDAVVVVAELPGADPERIVCRADGNRLLIEATGLRSYRKDLALPAMVRPDGIVQSFRNGILEVRLVRADPA